ncbi:MAG: hypothetical protein ACFFC7_13190 [Candidatus Hermodarchaeota archaeon]
MADIESWKLGLPILGAIILCIQNLLIPAVLFTQGAIWSFVFIFDLIGFSILGVGCLLLAIDHSRIINPLVAGVAFFGWVGFSLLWRFLINFYEMGTTLYEETEVPVPDLVILFFFFLGAISLVIAFFFYWRSISEYEGGRQFHLIGLLVSMIYTVANLIAAIFALLIWLGQSEPEGIIAAIVTLIIMGLAMLAVKMFLIPILGIINFVIVLLVLIVILRR